MKSWKILILTSVLSIGFILPSCQNDNDGVNCGGTPQPFFNIIGISDAGFYDDSNQEFATNTTTSLSGLAYLSLRFSLDYHAMVLPEKEWDFSFFQTLNACSPIFGWEGSKDEELVNFSIITLNDFDENHLSGDTINDLFDFFRSYSDGAGLQEGDPKPLPEFLTNQTGTIQFEELHLQLKQAPVIEEEVRLKIVVELSTEEIYEVEMEAVNVLPD